MLLESQFGFDIVSSSYYTQDDVRRVPEPPLLLLLLQQCVLFWRVPADLRI
ncbi:MAG TPA: hypothetical protein VKD65_03860 [Candidatus Angelobacter sp.]|nr:hypothetical protein [Candidatus Angelobacter sp.]